MSNIGGTNEHYKQQAQYMNIRGAQMAQQRAGQGAKNPTQRPAGSKRQLLGTIIGIAAVIAAVILLKVLHIL